MHVAITDANGKEKILDVKDAEDWRKAWHEIEPRQSHASDEVQEAAESLARSMDAVQVERMRRFVRVAKGTVIFSLLILGLPFIAEAGILFLKWLCPASEVFGSSSTLLCP